MRTFYDFRNQDNKDPKKYPVQGRVIFKSKFYWLIWLPRDVHPLDRHNLHGFIVAPRTIYLYNIYIGRGFWDAFKYFIKLIKSK